MLDDRQLAELMGKWAAEDSEGLLAMLGSMDEFDKMFFKGYVEGFSRGVEFAQRASVEDAERDSL